MISSFMLSSTPPRANASEAAGTTSASECPRRRAAHSRTATSGGGGTSRLGGAAANILGLVHVCTAGRLASDPYHGARHGLGLDRAVPGQRSYKRPGDEHAEQPGYALGRAALGPCTDQQPRPEDLEALELPPTHRFPLLPLPPAVE